MNITIKELPDHEVAYVRHVGSHLETGQAWGRLMHWSAANGLFPPAQSVIGVSLDNPDAVAPSAFRYDACVTIPEGFDKAGHSEVQFQTLPGGLFARFPFYDTIDRLCVAYQTVYEDWLPNSGYAADDRLPLEFSLNNPAEDPEGKCRADVYIPIVKKA